MRRFRLTCQKCGSSDFTLPEQGADSDPITCNKCGEHFATRGELRAEMSEQAAVTRQSDIDSIKWPGRRPQIPRLAREGRPR